MTVLPGTHSFLGRESAHTGEVSCLRTQRHTTGAETSTKDSQSKVAGHSPRHDALRVCGVYNLDVGTLRVVTVEDLSSVVLLRPTPGQ